MMKSTPVTVFTGFLGAGKTTIILSLLPQLPNDYKVVLLKNEFGDVEVDSQLALQSSLTAVSEILNGCILIINESNYRCCVLVGQMKTALLEIKEKHSPDRIIIETSGSAFPATLAFQIRQLEQETKGGFKLDAIVTVIDTENFTGYEDKSLTAKMQAQYTDVILLNKWENVSERQLDLVIDHLNDLNDETPRLRCSGRNGVPPSLIFGLDTKLYFGESAAIAPFDHHDEVETVTVSRGPTLHNSSLQNGHVHSDRPSPDDVTKIQRLIPPLARESLTKALATLSKESVWRVKGYVKFADDGQVWILNWAFGRYELMAFNKRDDETRPDGQLQLTIMGARGDMLIPAKTFAGMVGGTLS